MRSIWKPQVATLIGFVVSLPLFVLVLAVVQHRYLSQEDREEYFQYHSWKLTLVSDYAHYGLPLAIICMALGWGVAKLHNRQ